MNQITTIELAKACFDVSVDDRGRESFEADSHGLEAFRALIVAERDKELMGVGMEPVAYIDSEKAKRLLAGQSVVTTLTKHVAIHDDAELYTADQLAAARLQDQQKIAELEAQLAERKPLTDEQINDVVASFTASSDGYIRFNASLKTFARAIEAAHGIG